MREVGLRGATDQEVITYARKKDCVLLTIDRDFGNILDYPPGTHPGIIRLKIKFMPSKVVNSLLLRFFETVTPDEIAGNLVILEKDRYRVRKRTDTD